MWDEDEKAKQMMGNKDKVDCDTLEVKGYKKKK